MCQAVFFLISETLSSPEYWGRWDCASTMADILNRLGYRLRQVVKAKPNTHLGDGRYLRRI